MTSFTKLNAYGTLAAQEVWIPDGGYPSDQPITEAEYRALRQREFESALAVNGNDPEGGWLQAATHRLWATGQYAPPFGSLHHASILIGNALDGIRKKLLADDVTAISPTAPFVWIEDGENAGEPKWLLKYGDYTGNVNKDYGSGLWNYRVNNQGRLNFGSADEAKDAAEADLKDRLGRRLKAAKETLAIFDGDGNAIGA